MPDDQREAAGEVFAGPTVEAHSRAVLPGDNPKAIVLDFVQPLAAGWQLIGFGRGHGAMNPAAKVWGRNDMPDRWSPSAKESSPMIAPPGREAVGAGGHVGRTDSSTRPSTTGKWLSIRKAGLRR